MGNTNWMWGCIHFVFIRSKKILKQENILSFYKPDNVYDFWENCIANEECDFILKWQKLVGVGGLISYGIKYK